MVDDFEVALFLRESRTRHSLLTRQKTFEEPDDAQKRKPINQAAGSADTGILVESDDDDDETEPSLHNIPAATDDDTSTKRPAETDSPDASPERQRTSKRQKGKHAALDEEDQDEKKLRFQTNYESFNIYGWVLCLLVTRKGVAAKQAGTADTAEPKRQVLMEEWMATQAQGDMDEE